LFEIGFSNHDSVNHRPISELKRLKFAQPADLPVQQAVMVTNLKTAKALGITFPLPPSAARGTPSQRSVESIRLHGLNNFRNLNRTPRTFIGVLVMTGLVGKDAHEQHPAAARRTSRTHKSSRRLSGDRRHTHTNKQTRT